MLIGDLVKLSFEALRAHKLRTFLTVFGVVIGVTSVIAIFSIVVGMNAKVHNLINEMGTSTFTISKFGVDDYASDDAFRDARKRKDLKFHDMTAIEKGCEACLAVGADATTMRPIKFESRKLNNVPIVGATSSIFKIMDFVVAEGRAHTQYEDEHVRPLAIIGPKIKRELFEGIDPIGKEIKIGTRKYEIIGITKERGSMLGEDFDNYILIPLSTLLKDYGHQRSLELVVKAKSKELLPEAIDQARVIMRARRHVDFSEKDDFAVTTSDDMIKFYNRITGTIQIVAVAIPLIALIVAGIVVMNIMMVSVTERTREIGIRKALGAERRNVLLQFLGEALMMSLFGGGLGVGLGLIVAKILAQAGNLPFIISSTAILSGLFISTGVGVIFGLYPAFKGAKLNPVEAMRFES